MLHPPSGVRSSVPLGGIACGTMELRADGSFHSSTIENKSPAGGAKMAKSFDAFFGARVNGKSKILRTDYNLNENLKT